MSKIMAVRSAMFLVAVLVAHSSRAQDGPTTGLYQIISGRYRECCGIAGAVIYPLPDGRQAFVELTVDRQRNLAWMTLLGQDRQTVFSIPPAAPRSGFTFSLSNGMVFPDHIEFLGPPALPNQPSFNYIVSNSADALQISGNLTLPCLFCADVQTEFKHTNVVAVLLPNASIRVSEVEVCWKSVSNLTYQVQYQSALTPHEWTDLGSPVAGDGSTQCLADRVPPGQPRRFYRVLTLP